MRELFLFRTRINRIERIIVLRYNLYLSRMREFLEQQEPSSLLVWPSRDMSPLGDVGYAWLVQELFVL